MKRIRIIFILCIFFLASINIFSKEDGHDKGPACVITQIFFIKSKF